jgi:hypothetical protein
MDVTFTQKLKFWHSFFSQKDNFEADKKKSTTLHLVAYFEPKIHSQSALFGAFWSPRGPRRLGQSGDACSDLT